jgi:hypothetical protein
MHAFVRSFVWTSEWTAEVERQAEEIRTYRHLLVHAWKSRTERTYQAEFGIEVEIPVETERGVVGARCRLFLWLWLWKEIN